MYILVGCSLICTEYFRRFNRLAYACHLQHSDNPKFCLHQVVASDIGATVLGIDESNVREYFWSSCTLL